MASQGFRDWLNAGKPYQLIRPARALYNAVKNHGITVYHYPDDSHLEANTPEDHTPYSVTGWPSSNKRWKARALDIMPRGTSKAARKENADIARQLIKDRNAGHPGTLWIKYINWTDENGNCQQDRWMPNHTTRSSSDRDHVHVSGRSDVDDDTRADFYDPVARMNGKDPQMTAPLPGSPWLEGVSFVRPAANDQEQTIPWGGGTEPASWKFGDLVRAACWRIFVIYIQVRKILDNTQTLIDRPQTNPQLSAEQMQQILDHIDSALAAKVGQAVEATYGGEKFQLGVKAGLVRQTDDNPNT